MRVYGLFYQEDLSSLQRYFDLRQGGKSKEDLCWRGRWICISVTTWQNSCWAAKYLLWLLARLILKSSQRHCFPKHRAIYCLLQGPKANWWTHYELLHFNNWEDNQQRCHFLRLSQLPSVYLRFWRFRVVQIPQTLSETSAVSGRNDKENNCVFCPRTCKDSG